MRGHTNARLMILGEGDLRPELERLVGSLGLQARVFMPGFVPNPYAYMAKADLFVLSSRFEGLPTVLIEALACGCRVASCDCPSGPREILKDGELGALVPVGDVEAMSRAIEASLSLPRANGAQPADLEPYTERYSASRYLDLIRQSPS
jgi:glycosyltransferase involved in cell wall biosynthesis